MQRTVPHTSSDPIALYMRTYYSLLRTTDAIQIQALVESYFAMSSSLHVHARDEITDTSALTYTGLRLPPCITDVDMILLGQTEDVFENHGYQVSDWERVSSPGRRRRLQWNGKDTLAVFLSSRSDVDDLLPILTAYQIEWNKIYEMLSQSPVRNLFNEHRTFATLQLHEVEALSTALNIPPDEVKRLAGAWGDTFLPTLKAMSERRKQFRVRQLAGSQADYRKATARWWANVRECSEQENYSLEESPVYFVSSNLHSVINLLSGFAVRESDRIVEFLHEDGQTRLLEEYKHIQTDEDFAGNEPNFLYYASKKFLAARPEAETRRQEAEAAIGTLHIPSLRGFDVGAQLFPIKRLREDFLDPRLMSLSDFGVLRHSNALIMNIDYPLGLSAYELLSHVASRVGRLAGVYIMGKAATLNGRIGDVMIPHVIHDEHSNNTYLFANCFSAKHVAPYMTLGSVLDNQKAITAYGTFLQNSEYMDVFYQEGYTVLEMEAGPYLSAMYESVRPRRHPTDEIVRLYEATLDLGIVHYASDTPFSRGHNLGAGSLGLGGVEPTYASSIAILRRIFKMEAQRIEYGYSGEVHIADD